MHSSDRTRPILDYVLELEGRVRQYKGQDRRFRARWFMFGFLAGAAGIALMEVIFMPLR